ncbi:MAG: coproporphyrinogen III oxidase [Pelotomaculum sp. PtaB.Bin104]|nr:MAG: coproporphyrinogen III oxidase [Pelotomaculum sp. PtaB.Bin104]
MKIERYNQYSVHLLKKYGKKVYKLPVNIPGTCPNRDGQVGEGGCIFCDELGSGFDCLPASQTIQSQIAENKAFFRRRFKAEKFIVYFQAFTNTYLPFAQFRENIRAAVAKEAAAENDLVGLAISTRPDCVNDRYLDFLLEIKEACALDICVELGLQTVNYHTLARINRGHGLAEFIDAVYRIRSRGMATCAHLILNLPWDSGADTVESARVLSALGVDYVKLHSLYVVRGTVLGEMYERGKFEIISLEAYVEQVVSFLEHLDPAIVIQRLVGKGPREELLFGNWGASWWLIKKQIEERLAEKDTYQGRKFDYLNGKALRRFT